MSQRYNKVAWQDETSTQKGTLINAERLDQMQTAHHYADGFEEVDAVPTSNPGVDYHKVVFCTADTTFYRWDGTQWVKDVDDSTLALLEAHEADHANPHQVTKTQVGLGNVDNTSDLDKPISTSVQSALNSINSKIPAQASSDNQLADKNFVNSSIATNTANFLGTYDAESDLGFASATVDTWTDPPSSSVEGDVGSAIATKLSALGKTVTNNDYVFVSVNQSTTTDTDWYWRFKFNGSAWVYEFTLNNSSFTAAQWAAINSGITAGLVNQMSDVCPAVMGSRSASNSSGWTYSEDPTRPGYPYYFKFHIDGVTASPSDTYPIVSLSANNPDNSIFAPYCDTYLDTAVDGGVVIYASEQPDVSESTGISFIIFMKVAQ